MSQCKVAVYAICKNEIKHVKRWMEAVKEADGVYVLDTGSTDGSAEALAALGANVKIMPVTPWRFDKARNKALALVPRDADICVCCDLDEVFDPDWRQEAEKAWQDGVNMLSYRFYYDPNSPLSFFYRGLIHSREGFEWRCPIHETLYPLKPCKTAVADGIRLRHLPDPSKPRDFYLPMLEEAVRRSPDEPRMLHYLGREYMYKAMYDKAVPVLRRHAEICSWPQERAASLRYLGRCLTELKDYDGAREAFEGSIEACPSVREGYVEAALFFYDRGELEACLSAALGALAVTQPDPAYFNEGYAWGSLPWDLASYCAFKLGMPRRALFYAEKALGLSPTDQRLLSNRDMIKSFVEQL